jgi:N-acetylmuramoyl-L-alanine amidase
MPVMSIGRAILAGLVCALLAGQGCAAHADTPRHHKAAAHRAPVVHKPTHAKHGHVRHLARTSRHAPSKQAVHSRRPVWSPSPREDPSRPLIVVDAGHGGQDPGAIGVSGTLEKTVTLATALELRRVLLASGRYRVALTRTTDRSVSLANRLSFARSHDADLLIAIHADASPDRTARGASVYVSSGQKTTHLRASAGNAARIAGALSTSVPRAEPDSAWLQYSMIEQLDDDVRMTAEPARTAHLYVLGSHSIPSVLLEMGFLSNRKDEALLRKPAHRRVLVRAIEDAIDDYFAGIRASRT